MTRTPSVLVLSVLMISVSGLFLPVALTYWTLGGSAKASTWHSEISIDGFYCADGSRRAQRAAASTVLDAALGKAPANQAPHFAKLAATMQKGSAPLLFKIYSLAVHA
jgi:hypothetical protein